MDDRAYCEAQVRGFDSDRYVTALFAPAGPRADLFALYAFNLELARAREMVSEAALGRIRLQWWRDAIDECYRDAARRHQVVQPLAAAIGRHGLERAVLDRIVDAREADFDAEPPRTAAEALSYARDTAGGLNSLALSILGVTDDRMHDAARDIGAAWALTGFLRGLPHFLRLGRNPLPRDLMERFRVSAASLRDLRGSAELCDLAAALAGEAGNLLHSARTGGAGGAGPVLLQAVLARAYLSRLSRFGHDPFDPRNSAPLRYRAWRLMPAALTGRF